MKNVSKSAEITIKDVLKQGKRRNRNINVSLIEKAYHYADEKHKGQFRKSGEPYIIHPVHVAYIVADLGLDTQTICAALLHDVVEDTDAAYEDIENLFNKEIAQIVEGVTKLSQLFKSAEEKQAENYKKMFLAMEKDIRVILLKLADRLHNISTLEFLKRDRQIAISKETIEFYAPIAHKLGMYDMKMKLQDGAFRFLYPEEYEEVHKELEEKIQEKMVLLERTRDKLERELKRQRIPVIVSIETKHIYNIYQKVTKKNITIDQIKDLFALKIITKDKKQCYKTLGILNTIYKIMPGTFKDYITTPRNNMYQAIHEILLGEKGVVFEAQICSYDMNRMASYGITNYFYYMKNRKNAEQEGNYVQEKLSGIHDTLELQKLTEDPAEFLNTLKAELLDEEVYIFTPRGDIKVLPRGACAIDFAYAVHEEIGKHIKSCKINSIEMPITQKLENGNIVEIMTSEQICTPEEAWLEEVKTAKARGKILKILAQNQKEKKDDFQIQVMAINDGTVFLKLASIFAEYNLNMKSLITERVEEEMQITIELEVKDRQKLEIVKKELLKVEAIKEVKI